MLAATVGLMIFPLKLSRTRLPIPYRYKWYNFIKSFDA